MSPLSKSLEKRIQELTASIETQKAQLAAYEHVLHMEDSEGSVSAEAAVAHEGPVAPSQTKKVTTKKKGAKKKAAKKATRAAVSTGVHQEPAAEVSSAAFTGNKTSLVAEIVKSYGSGGATPKDVDAYFTARNIARSKNLIYNTLSYLVAQKKLQRQDGKYMVASGTATAKKTASAAPAKAATPTKRRLSPEGLKRIKEALKKRWAMKKAAEAATAKKK